MCSIIHHGINKSWISSYISHLALPCLTSSIYSWLFEKQIKLNLKNRKTNTTTFYPLNRNELHGAAFFYSSFKK